MAYNNLAMAEEYHERSNVGSTDSELRYSREQGFFDKNLVIRFLIGLTFALSMFIVLHFREAPVEIPEKDTIASKYVVAQVPFEFIDEEATLILKQEAVRDIGRIYKVSDKQVSARRAEFETDVLQSKDVSEELVENDMGSSRVIKADLLGPMARSARKDLMYRNLIRHDSEKLAGELMKIVVHI